MICAPVLIISLTKAAFTAAQGVLNGDFDQTTYSKIGPRLPAAR